VLNISDCHFSIVKKHSSPETVPVYHEEPDASPDEPSKPYPEIRATENLFSSVFMFVPQTWFFAVPLYN
jgi:hypothetical protein